MKYAFIFISILALGACRQTATVADEQAVAVTPVSVTTIVKRTFGDTIELNATSTFLLKSFIKANATGYLQMENLKPGEYIAANKLLFSIKTKEAQSIGNAVNQLDSTFHFSGTNSIRSSQPGYLSEVNHQPGDYVQDGEQLAIINGSGSFVFLLDLPYELRSFVKIPMAVQLYLADGSIIPGTIAANMPTVDAASQTQRMVIKIKESKLIPENLMAKVRIPKGVPRDAIMLSNEAIVTNEEQSQFWVMKVVSDSLAVRVDIKKGTASAKETEIMEPVFSDSDKIIISGNYGMEDSARISIISKPSAE